MSVHQRYTSELRRQFGYLAAWLPNVRLNLGDIGVLRRDRFEVVGTLAGQGIPFSTRRGSRLGTMKYRSHGVVDVQVSADAQLAASTATASVTFQREHAVLFHSVDCTTRIVADRDEVGAEVIARAKRGDWPSSHVVITELVEAGPTVVLVSGSSGANAVLSLAPDVAPDMAMAASTGVVRTLGMATEVVGESGLTPLFRAAGLLRRPKARRFVTRGEGDAHPDELQFADVEYPDD